MRKGLKATCVLATGLGLLVSGCGGEHKATRSSGGYAQPSTEAPGSTSAAPSASAPESSPPASAEPSASASESAGAVEIKAKDTSVGKIVVDGKEMTLYAFEKDKGGKPSCTGACASEWPPLIATGKVTAGPGVNPSLITTADRPDGTKQVAYHGWPLYHSVKDTKAGDMNGQGVTSNGGKWYVVDATKGEPIQKK